MTNYFDQAPVMSRMGEFVEFQGDSSDIAVGEAVQSGGHTTRRRQAAVCRHSVR